MRRLLSTHWVLLMLVAAFALGCSRNLFRVVFPSHAHETEAPALPPDLRSPAVLVVSKTNGFRHYEAIDAGGELLRELADRRGWSLFETENGAIHNAADLGRFDVVVWHNTSGDILDTEQRTALRSWIEAGGGFVAIHGAGGDPAYDWGWYVEELIGAQFIGHTMGPQFQVGRAVVENRIHPATRHLPREFDHLEEWYSFDRSVRDRPGFEVLVSVDESSYSPRAKLGPSDTDLAMGDHPVVWSHCVGRGRVLFSALGHQGDAYRDGFVPPLLEGAIAWSAGLEGRGCR